MGYNDFIKKAIKVKMGEFHYCAILEDESITCWGDNRDGQVGFGNKIFVDINEAENFFLE